MTRTIQDGLRALLIVALICFSSSCTRPQGEEAYKDHIRAWTGLPTNRLIRIWGAPQRTAELADGSTLMEYRERAVNRVTVPITGGNITPSGIRVENRVSWCVTRFVTRDGVVVSSSFEGTDCQPP